MNRKAGISVIIPTYKRAPLLTPCLNGLVRQTLLPDEIIVVDNYGDTETKRVVNTFRRKQNRVTISCVHEKRKGVSYARNRGVRTSRFTLLTFIDDDCVAPKNWLQQIHRTMRDTHITAVFGPSKNINPSVVTRASSQSTKDFFDSNLISIRDTTYSRILDTKNCAVRASFILKHRIAFRQFFPLEDVDFGLQISRRGGKIVYQKSMMVYHHERTNASDHLRREFMKGEAYFLFYRSWPSEKPTRLFPSIHKDDLQLQTILFVDRVVILLGYAFAWLKYQFL